MFKLTIRKKIILGFAVILLPAIYFLWFAFGSLSKIQEISVDVQSDSESLRQLGLLQEGLMETSQNLDYFMEVKSTDAREKMEHGIVGMISAVAGLSAGFHEQSSYPQLTEISRAIDNIQQDLVFLMDIIVNNNTTQDRNLKIASIYTDIENIKIKHQEIYAGFTQHFIQEAQEQKQLISKIAINLMLMILTFIVLSFVVAVFISYLLARPITKLTVAARNIKQGNFSVAELQAHRRDEIGDLSQAFEVMLKQIAHDRELMKRANLNLSEEVKKRTATLEKQIAELSKWQKLMVGRELKMIELKKELRKKNGEMVNAK